MRLLRLLASTVCAAALFGQSADWLQFRGPEGRGVFTGKTAVPTEFTPSRNLAWKQTTPEGHSSPVVSGDRVFLTGFDKQKNELLVLCLSRLDGAVRWRKTLIPAGIQKTHEISNPATASAVSDGQRVYAYFGSYGAVAFDMNGKEVWTAPMPVLKMRFGTGTSPVLAGDLLIVNHDGVSDGSLIALDRKTGKMVWETKYPAAGATGESYSTPVIWKDQIVLHRLNIVDAYELKTGRRVWWVHVPSTGTSTVAVDGDTVYAAAWYPLGESDQMPSLPDWETLKKSDANGDGSIQKDELPADLYVFQRPDVPNVQGARMSVRDNFSRMDMDKSGGISEAEWKTVTSMLPMMRRDHGIVAIRPDGEGDLTAKVVWTEKNAIPEVPSPLVFGDYVYLVRNGGIVSCLDKSSGKVVYRSRVGAPGAYFASPIAAGGHIYVASQEGVVSVLEPGSQLKVGSHNNLGEPIFATPAVSGDLLLIRTTQALYAFGPKLR